MNNVLLLFAFVQICGSQCRSCNAAGISAMTEVWPHYIYILAISAKIFKILAALNFKTLVNLCKTKCVSYATYVSERTRSPKLQKFFQFSKLNPPESCC